MMNVGIVFSDFGPYHAARIEALAVALDRRKSKLFAFQFCRMSNTYSWKPVLPAGVKVVTLSEEPIIGTTHALRVAKAFIHALREHQIDTVFLPSYSPLPNLFCLFSAKVLNCKTILMNESWHGTEQAGFVGRMAKHLIVRLFDAALVGGTPQKRYACSYGQKSANVFLGYDAVDTNYYAHEAKRWKGVSTHELPVPNLPKRFFLNLGRFVPKKNIAQLVRAYAKLVQRNPTLDVALVLVGEGSEEEAIRTLALNLQLRVRSGLEAVPESANGPEVVFYPFQQVDKTPLFFARCEAFILPSLYEEWGLVVNEAMACGTAVIVSENVGCAQDLVEAGKNGFRFNPKDDNQLTNLLEQFVSDPSLTHRFGQYGSILIRRWGPDRFSEGAISALNATRFIPNG